MDDLDFDMKLYIWFLTLKLDGGRPSEIKLNTGGYDVLFSIENYLENSLSKRLILPFRRWL